MNEENWVSPNEMMKKGKEIMLGGREPSSRDDWVLLSNFIAANTKKGLEESVCLFMRNLYDIPISKEDIMSIAKFQADKKT